MDLYIILTWINLRTVLIVHNQYTLFPASFYILAENRQGRPYGSCHLEIQKSSLGFCFLNFFIWICVHRLFDCFYISKFSLQHKSQHRHAFIWFIVALCSNCWLVLIIYLTRCYQPHAMKSINYPQSFERTRYSINFFISSIQD
jgi:hypothetical protein